jgi:hypothetical protein
MGICALIEGGIFGVVWFVEPPAHGKNRPRVTDWLDMKNPHTLTVPPGK